MHDASVAAPWYGSIDIVFFKRSKPAPAPTSQRLLHFFWDNYQRRSNDENVYQSSNAEIQKWAERMLGRHFAVHSTSCLTQGRVTLSKEDILLGQLTWETGDAGAGLGPSERDWVLDNRLRDDAPCHPNTYILTPWVPEFPAEWTRHMPWYEKQLEAARVIFAICGPIWLERTLALDDSTITGRVKSKLVRLNMCVNYEALRVDKARFSPAGQRKLIHVSNLASYKGFDLLAASTEGVTVPSVGSTLLGKYEKGRNVINVSGTKCLIDNIGAIDNTNAQQIQTLVAEHDFYLHTSSMDAQATTILEFGARGLVPIVTRESGFESEHAIYLGTSAEENREIIRAALHMPEEELRYRSECIKMQIKVDHSWQTFYDTIAGKIRQTCES
jgi:glycosyltransferase involved in cell wall biosynthesis